MTAGASTVARPLRLGAFAPSPVYYRSGLYRRVAADPRIEFTAIFSSSAGVRPGDLGYGEDVAFDADALSGFESVFLRKADRTESTGAFMSLFDTDVITEVTRRRFDALWLHGYYSATHLMAATTQLALGRKLLIREEQTLLSPRPMWKRTLKHVLLQGLLRCSYGLYIGANNRRWFTHHGLAAHRAFHVPFCVDNDRFSDEARRLGGCASELRAGLGVGDASGPLILTVSRFAANKRIPVILDAFRRVRAESPCVLVLVGAGPAEADLREYVRRHSIPDVVFAGFLNQSAISRAYAAADLFVLASGWNETWGLVVNEAMSFGLPIVVSDRVGCAADLVFHGRNGFVFENGRSVELAGYLSRLVEDDGLRRSFGQASKEIIAPWNDDAALVGVLAALRAAVGDTRWREAEAHAAGSANLPSGRPMVGVE
jgi:glycosyltransferase involved in cell wall biosynthesis